MQILLAVRVFSKIHLSPTGSFVFFLFKEPPYFTVEPESRIFAEVEENVDIVCQAMGEYGGAPKPAAVRWRSRAEPPRSQGPAKCDV